eukprot:NODE_8931_length_673_cov_95.532727_g8670_i0.p1 GENE.NODE_8931_length_673_cov_95.532727_g8670_i0~~NODE_8931_length_673_cov_95.532727_g8670_i0.p1  ORF type:complete len:202 (-),score=28.77 NODE_8931_length_673_cov_95.532727_g8670_i0:68-619(-)
MSLYGQSPHLIDLIQAVKDGDRNRVLELIKEYPGLICERDDWRRTPLHVASEKGHIDCARLLLQHKADVNETDECRRTPLYMATEKGHTNCVRLLLEHKADVEATAHSYKCTPLLLATLECQLDCTRLLLEHNADVNATDSFGRTALGEAQVIGHHAIANLLRAHICTPLVLLRCGLSNECTM